MLKCISFKSSTSSSTIPNPSQEGTPSISREYNLAVHTTSYTEIRSNVEAQLHHLNPNRDRVQDALTLIPTRLTRLISTFFDHTETASDLCLHLHQCLLRARDLHAPLLDFFQTLNPTDPTQNDCVRALRLFHPFHAFQNPIPDSLTFSAIRSDLSALKTQLDRRVAKSLSRLRIVRRAVRGSALCLVAVAIAVVAATVAVTLHAVAALAAAGAVPVCAFEKKELAELRQLDAAAKCAYVLSNDLATIDALASRLRAAVEGDKVLVRLVLERGNERYLVEEVIKQLWKSHKGFLEQVEDLEEHIFLCFYNINKARFLVLQEITSNPA
ncbi:hypothetical protein GLYMA_16G148000v4 [Glycine max]|uniref:Uncharacterized protein n=1 Tax=Glycine max TaxID=3847 RepID=I1MNP6_SOYBN|nr:UPF0496 protein At3g19330 isoform X1 [Glycine max]KAG4939381.1 hypothetical protein JHK86_045522 [Glycine max]KAG4952234.1 hypothetical protein JHK85_046101 [Glycine max]KRH08420.1 hypothetical protein GLYMA_16G148000v4 [Glycine max]|eukprot:XP_006599418.1 UPF0496 protein At3g19330 [Glycine max]